MNENQNRLFTMKIIWGALLTLLFTFRGTGSRDVPDQLSQRSQFAQASGLACGD